MSIRRQTRNRRQALSGLAAVSLAVPLLAFSGAVQAQADAKAWPSKPVTLVVPFPPGGTSDVIGRQLAKQMGEVLKASVVVDNKPGASTSLGATAVARAPKDGHTLLLSSGSTFTTTPHLMPVTYKLTDFAPLGTVATVPFAFVVKKDFPAKTVAEFVAKWLMTQTAWQPHAGRTVQVLFADEPIEALNAACGSRPDCAAQWLGAQGL